MPTNERRFRTILPEDEDGSPFRRASLARVRAAGEKDEGNSGEATINVDQILGRISQLNEDIRRYMSQSNGYGARTISGSRAKQKRFKKINSGCEMIIEELEHHASLMMRRGDY